MFNFFCLKESFLRQISEAGWNRVGVTNGNSALHSWKKEKNNSDKNIQIFLHRPKKNPSREKFLKCFIKNSPLLRHTWL